MTDSACATETGKIATKTAAWRPSFEAALTCLTRQHTTERARLSELNCDRSGGLFACTSCGERLYALDAIHWSTGRPRWTRRARVAATKPEDRRLARRIEGQCARRNARRTHAFPDGLGTPTRLRCGVNGGALQFRPGGT